MDAFEGLLREALIVAAVLALPPLLVATLAGALVAVVQAATGVQEQTLTLLPKILAVGATLVIFGRFGMELCVTLMREVLAALPALAQG